MMACGPRLPTKDVRYHGEYRGYSGRVPKVGNSPFLPSRPGELHPESLTDPDVILSHHPARATKRRLPPSIVDRAPPAAGCADTSWPDPMLVTRPLRSTGITPLHHYYEAVRP